MTFTFPKKPSFLILILLACGSFISFNGCKNEDVIRAGDPINVAYKKAYNTYQKQKYREAAMAFETVIKASRGTKYARISHYFLAEAYFNSGQYLLAADAYKRFLSLYPRSPKVEKVNFKEALSYYKLSPRFMHDQKYTHEAIDKFQIFISQYPNSGRLDKAGQYITQMRTKLAHKKYNAAQLYFKLDQYKAAVVYYNLVVDEYPGTSWAEKALVREIETYNEYASKSIKVSKSKRYSKAVDTYEKYIQLFPNGEGLSKARKAVNKARKALAGLGPANSKKKSQNTNLSADQ